MIVGAGCRAGNEKSEAVLVRPGLDRALRTLSVGGHPGVVALLKTDAGVWRAAAGLAEGERRAHPDDRFAIASTTKAFVAAAVLQLVGERRLALQDLVHTWLPGLLPDGRLITIRHLLNHTSGLAQDVGFGSPPRERVRAAVGTEPGRLLFRPGSGWYYSNTNYVVLGLVVEKVTGRRLSSVVRDRIFRPLHLDHTSYGSAVMPAATATGWLGLPQDASGPVAGDGGIVSTTTDLATFFRALLSGHLLHADELAEMTRTLATGEGVRYGLGIARWRLSCGTGWGHGGLLLGTYRTEIRAARDGSKVAVLAENGDSSGDTDAVVDRIYCSERAPKH